MLTSEQLQQACHGRWFGGMPAASGRICTDSRSVQQGDIFLALRGANFDGHAFAHQLADRAIALIGDRAGRAHWQDLAIPQLEVDDTLRSFGDIARAWRNRLPACQIIAISGSYGKTTVRSMLQHAFCRLGLRVAATSGNYNNLIGVPQTLLAIPEDCELALIECGISERGEMARLAAIVEPDYAVLTGISLAHGAGLGTIRDIAREKFLLCQAIRGGKPGVVGMGVAQHLAAGANIIDVELNGVQGELAGRCCVLRLGDETASIPLPLPAHHWVDDMALVATVIRHWAATNHRSIALAEIAGALHGWQPVGQRMQPIMLGKDRVLLDDAYNANPASMQAALQTLLAMPGERMAILGDMAELGTAAQAAHAALDVHGIEQLLLIGSNMKALADITPHAHWFATTGEAVSYLSERSPAARTQTFLVKGSRSMHLEHIVTLLRAADEEHHAL